jgi:death on curing protein
VATRRREPLWVDRSVVDAIHYDQVREHGGLGGVRDENALESALARPKDQWHYEPKSDVPTVAAAYGWGLARSHRYRDGNKRVAFLVMATFLELNGWVLGATEPEVVQVMLAVAAGQGREPELADWIRSHAAPGRRR